jgi:simple sugar transport system permease protein
VAITETGVLPSGVSLRSRRLRATASSLAAVVLALIVGGILVIVAGGNPFSAYASFLSGSLGSRFAIGLVLVQTTPLLLIGLGLALAFRGRVYNIGAEGQFYMGALAGGVVGAALGSVAAGPGAIALMVVAGIAGGAAWGLIVGLLRARWRVNEVISSLLLNYVATYIFAYVVRKPLRDPQASFLVGKELRSANQLPTVSWLSAHAGILIAFALVPVVWYAAERAPFGFRVRMMGLNAEAARAAGVNTPALIATLMAISGGFAGLAGIVQVLGVTYRLDPALSNGYGFTAIVVALLGRLNAIGVLLAALFIGTLTVGGQAMAVDRGLPFASVLAIEGVFVVFVVIANRFVTW